MMNFDQINASRTDSHMTFAKDSCLIQVPIEHVAYCDGNGQQGRNYWGERFRSPASWRAVGWGEWT
jgi:hypothetical protein